MKRTTKALLVLGALLGGGAVDIAGQNAPVRPGATRGFGGVEAIMRMRDRLELSDEQIARLDGIRRELVARRSAERAEVAEMRSQLAAGQIRRSELMAFMEDRREARRGRAEEMRARIEEVLTESQLESVGEMRRRGRALARGRAPAARGPGAGIRGGRPGMRGDGSGFGRGRPGMPSGRRGPRGARRGGERG